MRYLWIFICATLLCGASSRAHCEMFNLLVMGDSLSAGYGLGLSESFADKLGQALKAKGYSNLNVINDSRSGETAAGGVQKLSRALAQKPDAVLLELGINDALRDRPINEIEADLERIIQTFKNDNIPVMLIGMQAPLVKPAPYAQQFKQMYANLAKKHSLQFYPFFMDGVFKGTTLIAMQMPNENVLADRIHPSSKGVNIMVQKILPSVQRFLNPYYRP